LPRKPHVPKSAKNTSVRLAREDYEAQHEIAKAREANHNDRTRLNDILVDGLWELLKKETGKTRKDIEALLPPIPVPEPKNNITPMPKPKKRH